MARAMLIILRVTENSRIPDPRIWRSWPPYSSRSETEPVQPSQIMELSQRDAAEASRHRQPPG